MIEKRAVPRRRVFKAGRLEFASERVDCTVRNLSTMGATLEVITSCGIPHEVILDIVTREERYPCYIVWRDRKRLGVVFRQEDERPCSKALIKC
jgi:hypothetical protein